LPVYDVAALSEAFEVEPRQIDNLLSRNEIAGVDRRTRGVTRRVALDAAITIRIALELSRVLRVPSAHALRVAAGLAENDMAGLAIGSHGILRFDLPELRASTLERLDSAVETVGRRRRGRPTMKRAGSAR
jgi:hypothetical protein